MIRRCDGNDPNLTRPVRDGERPRGPWGWRGMVPCDCGAAFDDRYRLVIWPHERTGGTVLEELQAMQQSLPGPVLRPPTLEDFPPLPPPTPSSLTDAQVDRLVAMLLHRVPTPPRGFLARRWCWLRTRHRQPAGGPCRCRSVVTYPVRDRSDRP